MADPKEPVFHERVANLLILLAINEEARKGFQADPEAEMIKRGLDVDERTIVMSRVDNDIRNLVGFGGQHQDPTDETNGTKGK